MNRRIKITAVILLGLLVIGQSACNGREPNPPPPQQKAKFESEEPKHPEIHLAREGHLAVGAKSRVLSWEVSDPSGLASVEARIVKVEEGSMKPTEVFRSDQPAGRVDLASLKQGPGLYAILVKASSNRKEENEAGLRLSYAEINPDCPTEKAWWPRVTAAKSSVAADTREAIDNPYAYNLLNLTRHSQYVVVATVSDLIACPTREGHLFTFVRFKDVKTLQKEGSDDAPQELILRVPGGMAYGRVEVVTDAPVFRSGDQVMLFLTRDPQQQVPIVQGANGVMLLEQDGLIRSYNGPLLTGVGTDFSLKLDSGYKPNPEHARHWDPNMRAVWQSPIKSAEPIGKQQVEAAGSDSPMTLETFAEYLEQAWAEAGKRGKLPIQLDTSPRRPYGDTPQINRAGQQFGNKLQGG